MVVVVRRGRRASRPGTVHQQLAGVRVDVVQRMLQHVHRDLLQEEQVAAHRVLAQLHLAVGLPEVHAALTAAAATATGLLMNSFRKNSDLMDRMYLWAGKVRSPACSVTSWMASVSSASSSRLPKCSEKEEGETVGISNKLWDGENREDRQGLRLTRD